MILCQREHLTDLLLTAYVDACEEQNPGLVVRTIEAVSGEITDMLSQRYPQPWPQVPELVRYCAAVIAAYRVVQAVTSLVRTEGGTDNEWLPLQKQWKYCTELLVDMAQGRVQLPLPERYADQEDSSVVCSAPPQYFKLKGF